jgi:hypothetical protein
MGRVLEISLPSEEVKIKIKEEAKKRGCTASKYILSALDEANRPTRLGTGPDLQHLREKNYRLGEDHPSTWTIRGNLESIPRT